MAAEVNKPDFSYVWASGGAIVAPSDVKKQTGWTAEVPPFQWENFLQNRQDNAILHLFQKGISEWDVLSNYYFTASGVRSYVQGSDGVVYVAVADSLNQNPTTDSTHTYWKPAFKTGTLANQQFLTATGTVTKTVGVTKWRVRQLGGGGQGGGTQITNATEAAAAGGGSVGSYAEAWFDVTSLVSASLVIGAGGSTGAAGAAGVSGGTTTLTMGSNSLTCPGGPGGGLGLAIGSPPNDGGQAAVFSTAPSHVGALSFVGTQGGGATSGFVIALQAAIAGLGGSTPFGFARAASVSGNSVGYGSGGSGRRVLVSTAAQVGYFGGNGLTIIEEYY